MFQKGGNRDPAGTSAAKDHDRLCRPNRYRFGGNLLGTTRNYRGGIRVVASAMTIAMPAIRPQPGGSFRPAETVAGRARRGWRAAGIYY